MEAQEDLPDLFSRRSWGKLATRLQLTPRQKEVAYWICKGYDNRKIAEMLGLARDTAGYHVQALMKKLSVQQRVGVVVRLVVAERELA
jgi:DNA-binding NarL/FixJ family response regulator